MPSKIIKLKCPHCDEIADELSRSAIGEMTFVKLKCGHSIIEEQVKGNIYDFESSDGRTPRPFQIEGIQFAEQSGGRCLIGDEMGLGKTIQALGFLKLHPELCPALFVVKAVAKLQWFSETIRWCGLEYASQIIPDSKTPIIPGFKTYIITYDLLRRLNEATKSSLNVKTVVLDECQQIKNHLSTRAKEVQMLCKNVEHIIALSGTPIKNNAGEYFTILNLLKPRRFPYYADFIRTYCDAYDSGWGTKVGGLRNADYFHTQTQDFIIRRTREQVAPEIPKISRNFFHVELQKKYEKAYQQAQEELEEEYLAEGEVDMQLAIVKMTKLRHIVGFNKINPTVDFLEEFLLDREPEAKIVVFTHHIDVTDTLISNIKEMLRANNLDVNIQRISSDQSQDARAQAVEDLRNDIKSRICIASTLAAGESLNLQFVNDCILMERQWNPANEEQVEGRFLRLGRIDESKPVTGTYMIASGTIDEFFTELVEQKRAIVASTLDNKEIPWDQQSLMKELLDVIVAKGGKRWKLK